MSVRVFEFREDIRNGKAVDMVLYGPADDQNTKTWAKVSSLIPPEEFTKDPTGIKQKHMTFMWDAIRPAYEAWKDGIALPEFGTPLGAWPALNKGQIAALRTAGLKSIEDVRDIPESMINKVRVPGMRELIVQAKLYLDGVGKAEMAREAQERDAKIDTMTDELGSVKEQLAAAMALLEEKTSTKKTEKAKAA